MLSLSLQTNEYVSINGNIVVKVSKMAGGRCFLAIEADKSIPIVRGAVLERDGTPPPPCIAAHSPRKKFRRRPNAVFRWNDDRERAVRSIQKVADLLEKEGSEDAAKILRIQLEQIVPQVWEEDLAAK